MVAHAQTRIYISDQCSRQKFASTMTSKLVLKDCREQGVSLRTTTLLITTVVKFLYKIPQSRSRHRSRSGL